MASVPQSKGVGSGVPFISAVLTKRRERKVWFPKCDIARNESSLSEERRPQASDFEYSSVNFLTPNSAYSVKQLSCFRTACSWRSSETQIDWRVKIISLQEPASPSATLFIAKKGESAGECKRLRRNALAIRLVLSPLFCYMHGRGSYNKGDSSIKVQCRASRGPGESLSNTSRRPEAT